MTALVRKFLRWIKPDRKPPCIADCAKELCGIREQVAAIACETAMLQDREPDSVFHRMRRAARHNENPFFADERIPDKNSGMVSCLCRQEHFALPQYAYWCKRIKEVPRWHRKQWEFVYICQALWEAGMLDAGKRGLGFGVGKEPLVALFAALGCNITATDSVFL